MEFGNVNENGLVLLGCGRMGSALLNGWLARGVAPGAVWVVDPQPGDWLAGTAVKVNAALPDRPAVVVVAVKPQMMQAALPSLESFGGGKTLILSIAAGTRIATFEEAFGAATPVVRAMPNTPAAIGQGITAIIGNAGADDAHLALAEALLAAVGQVVRLDREDQMDAVTALSGSGPAYVFHLIEAMAEAGAALGLDPALARQLAVQTVAGAGALAAQSGEDPDQLRVNVTSPGGTTAAALEVLMDEKSGFRSLLLTAMRAAAARSRELS